MLSNFTFIGKLFYVIRFLYRKIFNKISTLRWILEGVTVGKNSTIERGVEINCPKKVFIGNNSHIRFGTVITTEDFENGNLKIGNSTNINRNSYLDITGSIEICDNVTISNNTNITTHSHGDYPENKPLATNIVIKDSVWIGSFVHVLPSVKLIEKNSLIGTNAILTKDTEKNGVYVGFPAKKIRDRM